MYVLSYAGFVYSFDDVVFVDTSMLCLRRYDSYRSNGRYVDVLASMELWLARSRGYRL